VLTKVSTTDGSYCSIFIEKKCKLKAIYVESSVKLVVVFWDLSCTWPHLNSAVGLEEGEY